MKFTFSVKIVEHIYGDEHNPIERHTGEVEAENMSAAKSLAWVRIVDRGKEIHEATGVMVTYQQFQCSPASLAVMTSQAYQQEALRTLYPDLTYQERLGLCGLGLPAEIGEVLDMLKKYLYHRNGKPLDIEKIKDELGDVMWYVFILLDTVGLTFEEVLEANVAKCRARHPNGFNPRYASDSHASEEETHHA